MHVKPSIVHGVMSPSKLKDLRDGGIIYCACLAYSYRGYQCTDCICTSSQLSHLIAEGGDFETSLWLFKVDHEYVKRNL